MQEEDIDRRKIFPVYIQMVISYEMLLHCKRKNEVKLMPGSLVSKSLSSRIYQNFISAMELVLSKSKLWRKRYLRMSMPEIIDSCHRF